MRRAFPIVTVLAALAALASPVSAQGGLTVLRSDPEVLELEWTWSAPELENVPTADGPARRPALPGGLRLAGPGQPDLPSLIELVGIPAGPELPRITVSAVDVGVLSVPDMAPGPREEFPGDGGGVATVVRSRQADPFGAGISPARWAELLGTTDLRGQRVARLAIHPFRYDADRSELQWARRFVVRVEFPRGAARSATRPDRPLWEEAMDSALLNAPVARRWRTSAVPAPGRGTADSFASSSNWLKFPVAEAGVYRLDYFTFSNLGVDPGSIDPRTIRVFAGRNLPLEESLATPPPPFMTECALKYVGADPNDPVFDTEDRFLFYALSPHGWANEYDSSRLRTEYIENQYTDHTHYWVTWGGSFSSSPRRMATRIVDPAADPTATFVTSAPWREHYEENNSEAFRYRDEDGWIWEDLRGRGADRLYQMLVRQPASGDGILTARLLSHESGALNHRTVELKVATDSAATYWEWCHSANSALYDVTACFDGLLFDGVVPVRVNANVGDPDATDNLFTAWFDLEYDRQLSVPGGHYFKFLADPVMPALPPVPLPFFNCTNAAPPESIGACPDPPTNLRYGDTAFEISGLDADPDGIYLFDVSDQHGVEELTSWALSSGSGGAPWNLRFLDPPAATGIRWYVAVTMDGVRQLSGGEQVVIRDLRSSGNGADYVVIHHPRFAAGAQRLADIRSNAPGDAMTAIPVSVDDIYQEFSWGMRDPVAIRDFLAWTLGDTGLGGWGGGAPIFAALVGDAAYDTKGYLSGSPPDYLSTYTRRYREAGAQYVAGENIAFYSTDDFFGYLRADDYSGSVQPGLDVAIGRFPVANEQELDLMLDKIEAYTTYSSPGQWQNRVLLVADDERVLSDTVREPIHTQQVEEIAQVWFPPSIDKVKVYLTEFPRDPFGRKPESQAAFIEEFTRGALHTSYTGHGDQSTMAQEEVFVSSKVPELLNEDRYTVFSTFSCTVSRFDLLSGNSMTELLLKHEGGGAVTTFASGGLVFPGPSFQLNQEWLSGMYGTPYLIGTNARTVRPIGLAALLGKAVVNTNTTVRQNSEKYITLGDPALRTRFGRTLVRFEPATVDSQTTDGLLRRIDGFLMHEDGTILDGSGGHAPFNGTAWVHVTELADSSGYDYADNFGTPRHIDYVLAGPTAFRGQVPVENGRFSVRFFLSEAVREGNSARISVFGLEGAGERRDASGSYESLVIAPTISPSQVQDSEGPRVTIRFEGYDRFVDGDLIFTDKPVLTIELEDESGINLRPFPQFARLEAELDGRERINLADDFSYDEGGFTQGSVRRILPLAPGKHTLEVKAFDNVNNRGSSRVEFEIVLADAEFDLVDEYIAVYPNPFRSRADFLLRLTTDAEVELMVFTITGRRIWETSLQGVAGDNVISWDGRDENGTPLANGTYLFKVKARSTDTEGNAATDEYVGKVVRMQ